MLGESCLRASLASLTATRVASRMAKLRGSKYEPLAVSWGPTVGQYAGSKSDYRSLLPLGKRR